MSTEVTLTVAAAEPSEQAPAAQTDSPFERLVQEHSEAPEQETRATPFELLLARPEALMNYIQRGAGLNALVQTALFTVVAGAAIYGAAIGAYRGGFQILYAAIKLPLALLLTTAACAPALTALGASLGRRSDVRRDIALVLSSLARTSLTLAALTPLLLLAIRRESEYHHLVLLLVGSSGVAGAVGLWFFLRGLRALDATAIRTTALAVSAVFMLVGVQMSWSLRPYLVRPRDTDVVLVRKIEGSFVEAVRTAAWSAAGVYPAREAREYEE
jgi:hypothetical protein